MLPKIFSGVKVIDFSRLLPGPFTSELLIKMGAEVKCVVPPSGDPVLGEYSPFESIRRGKSFHPKDLKDPGQLREVQAWVKESQILLEGFRPGTMGRLGLGFEAVAKLNSEIIYVSIAGYAPDDEKYFMGAHDLNFLIDAGVYSLMYGDADAQIPILQLADVFGGFFAAFQILAAWIARPLKPGPMHLQVSIVEGLKLLSEYLKDPKTKDLAPMLTGGAARYHIYRTKDDKRIFIGAIEGKFFGNLMGALGLPYGDYDEGADVIAAIERRFQEKNLEEWKRILAKEDVCVSFIPSREEVLKGTGPAVPGRP
jgi:crotonobetainyl-CoA:carnitine CoA-transferase CaiB-like acyl-CoA transferase